MYIGPEAKLALWLYGMAGIGKSTIARTAAVSTDEKKMLGASFFFSRRGNAELRDHTFVIPTLAHQLSYFDPGFRQGLLKTLKANPDIAAQDLPEQIKLLVEPLKEMTRTLPFILILDALDECEGDRVPELLELLLGAISTSSPNVHPKLLVTSRPDLLIQQTFEHSQHFPFDLRNVEEAVVKDDIRRYLIDELTQPESDWPSAQDLETLVEMSGQLFVYAATALRFIANSGLASRPRQLEKLLAMEPSSSGAALGNLDDLYTEVLRTSLKPRGASREDSPDLTRRVVGATVTARNPLSVLTLARLLEVDPEDIRSILARLSSVIIPPEHDNSPVESYHQSFPDFIKSAERCYDKRFLVQSAEHERQMAVGCLRILKNSLVKRNIAGFDQASLRKPNHEIVDFRAKVAQTFSRELKYACIYWASHVSLSPLGDSDVMAELGGFAKRRMLWWMEALSLLAYLNIVAKGLREVRLWAVRIFV